MALPSDWLLEFPNYTLHFSSQMKIPMEIFILIVWPIAAGLIVGGLYVNDRITRHVCRRDGIQYSFLWIYNLRWHWRTCKLTWFKDARDAGYFGDLLVLQIAYYTFFAVIAVLIVGGFVGPAMKNV